MRIAKRPLLLGLSSLAILSLVVAAVVTFGARNASAASIGFQTIQLTRAGSGSLNAGPTATDFTTQPDEIDAALNGDADADNGGGDGEDSGVNRTLPGAKTGHGKPVSPNAGPKSNPTLGTHFQGLNFFDQRFANNGNQFCVEPPDQALCAGNGFVRRDSQRRAAGLPYRRESPASGQASTSTRSTAIRRQSCARTSCGRARPVHHRPGLLVRPGHRAFRPCGIDARPCWLTASLNGNESSGHRRERHG